MSEHPSLMRALALLKNRHRLSSEWNPMRCAPLHLIGVPKRPASLHIYLRPLQLKDVVLPQSRR